MPDVRRNARSFHIVAWESWIVVRAVRAGVCVASTAAHVFTLGGWVGLDG